MVAKERNTQINQRWRRAGRGGEWSRGVYTDEVRRGASTPAGRGEGME